MKKIFNLRSILISIIIISFFAIFFVAETKGLYFGGDNIFTSLSFYLAVIVLASLILVINIVTEKNKNLWREIRNYQKDVIERAHKDQEEISEFDPDKEKLKEDNKNET